MDVSQVDFNGLKNVTCRKLINSENVLCWYAELEFLTFSVVASTSYSSNHAILSILLGNFCNYYLLIGKKNFTPCTTKWRYSNE